LERRVHEQRRRRRLRLVREPRSSPFLRPPAPRRRRCRGHRRRRGVVRSALRAYELAGFLPVSLCLFPSDRGDRYRSLCLPWRCRGA